MEAAMRRGAILLTLAAAMAAAPGCGPETVREPAETDTATAPSAPPVPPPIEQVRAEWKWEHPGAVVLEVRAADAPMVAMLGGATEGLAPELTVRFYRGNAYLASGEVVEVGPEFTVARLLEDPVAPILPGDAGVYLPLP